ncbi:hypothetical protein DB88DRAFT_470635 [Papiliotrema laurentii]|uniref:Uncharacterized protein n=1 Tax=Papiliotrema laurentii TaxID=5418 RepID=A0AAD9L799_PAPLA|nr:hypothetical protein DB88DRAFT_470635 [Papiliotrema laurentii]
MHLLDVCVPATSDRVAKGRGHHTRSLLSARVTAVRGGRVKSSSIDPAYAARLGTRAARRSCVGKRARSSRQALMLVIRFWRLCFCLLWPVLGFQDTRQARDQPKCSRPAPRGQGGMEAWGGGGDEGGQGRR